MANFLLLVGCTAEPPNWTGFGVRELDDSKIPAKTLWDWLDLLIIPVAIGTVGWLVNQFEKVKAKKSEEETTQNKMIDSYFQIMTSLIIDHNIINKPTLQILAIARARINIAVQNVNAMRKGIVLQFLYESKLIDYNPTIDLNGINFQNVVLDEIVLKYAEIKGAYFNGSSIQKANLSNCVFVGCDFSNANISSSLVENTDFSYCNLKNAILKDMNLITANFEGANLCGANLRGSSITKSQLENIFEKESIKTDKKLIL